VAEVCASNGQRPLSPQIGTDTRRPQCVRSSSFAVNNSQRRQPSDLLRLNEANAINRNKRPAWSSGSTSKNLFGSILARVPQWVRSSFQGRVEQLPGSLPFGLREQPSRRV
jgi:hypothetical protein